MILVPRKIEFGDCPPPESHQQLFDNETISICFILVRSLTRCTHNVEASSRFVGGCGAKKLCGLMVWIGDR
jgi:hypothetical protein